MQDRIFSDWLWSRQSELWGQEPVQLQHRLDRHPLFDLDRLALLIERYPEDRYTLVRMGKPGEERSWEEGKLNNRPGAGRELLRQIQQGRLWINLLHTNEVDPEFQNLLDEIYAEIHERLPDYPATFQRICGVLISSPGAQVYYHFDTTGQNLWQIRGSKRVWLYPPEPPFLQEHELEDVQLFHKEVGITYQRWYDEQPRVRAFDLTAGSMLHWPLNAPHRIGNLGFSVSLTTEFKTRDIQRHCRAVGANGLLRRMRVPQSWVPYPAKLGLLAAAKVAGVLDRGQRARRPVVFRL